MFQKVKEIVFPQYKPTEEEMKVYDIIQTICQHPDTEFKIAPISVDYLIRNITLEYNLSITEKDIVIANHNFYFSHHFPQAFHEQVIEMVSEYIERDRQIFRDEMFANKAALLNNIQTTLENGTNEGNIYGANGEADA